MYTRVLRIVACVLLMMYVVVDCVHAAPLVPSPDKCETLAAAQAPGSIAGRFTAKVGEELDGVGFSEAGSVEMLFNQASFMKNSSDVVHEKSEILDGDVSRGRSTVRRSLIGTFLDFLRKRLRGVYLTVMLVFMLFVASTVSAQDAVLQNDSSKPAIPEVQMHGVDEDFSVRLLGSGFMKEKYGKKAIGINIDNEKAESIKNDIDLLPGTRGVLSPGTRGGVSDIYVEFSGVNQELEDVFFYFSEYGYLPWANLWHTVWKENRWKHGFSHVGAGGLGQIMRNTVQHMIQEWRKAPDLLKGIETNEALLKKEIAKLDAMQNATRAERVRQEKDVEILKIHLEAQRAQYQILQVLAYTSMSSELRGEFDLDDEPGLEFVNSLWLNMEPSAKLSPSMMKRMNTKKANWARTVTQVQNNPVLNLSFCFALKNFYYIDIWKGVEIAKIDGDHKDAIDRNTEPFITTEMAYNRGETFFAKEIKDGFVNFVLSCPSETRRYGYEYIEHVVFPAYERYEGEDHFYALHGDPEIADKLMHFFLVQYHLDQSDKHVKIVSRRTNKPWNEIKGVSKWLAYYNEMNLDYVSRFKTSGNGKVLYDANGYPIRKGSYTNTDFASISYKDILSIGDSVKVAELPLSINSFAKDMKRDLKTYYGFLDDLVEQQEKVSLVDRFGNFLSRDKAKSSQEDETYTVKARESIVEHMEDNMPVDENHDRDMNRVFADEEQSFFGWKMWPFIGFVGAVLAGLMRFVVVRMRKRSDREMDEYSAESDDYDSYGEPLRSGHVGQLTLLLFEHVSGVRRKLEFDVPRASIFESGIVSVWGAVGVLATVGMMPVSWIVHVVFAGIFLLSQLVRVILAQKRSDIRGAIRNEILDVVRGIGMLFLASVFVVVDIAIVKPIYGWKGSRIKSFMQIFQKSQAFEVSFSRGVPITIIGYVLAVVCAVYFFGVGAAAIAMLSYTVVGYGYQVVQAVRSGQANVSVVGSVLLTLIPTFAHSSNEMVAALGVAIGGVLAFLMNKVKSFNEVPESVFEAAEVVSRPGIIKSDGNVYREALFSESYTMDMLLQPIENKVVANDVLFELNGVRRNFSEVESMQFDLEILQAA